MTTEDILRKALAFVERYTTAFSSGQNLPKYDEACALADELRAALSSAGNDGAGE